LAGCPIEIVQMILGHSSDEITRRIYAHLIGGEAADQINEAAKLLTRHRPYRRTM
jgi:integrase